MRASDIPSKFPLAFAQNASGTNIRSIPTTSTDPNAASLNLGFPPNVFNPISAGGSPPDGRDMNGILFESTGWLRWVQAGGAPLLWDSAFSAAVGGYPLGAIVVSATYANFWISTADNNTTNPDAGGAGWTTFPGVPTPIFHNSSGAWSNVVPPFVNTAKVTFGGAGAGGAGSDGTHNGGGGGSGGIVIAWVSVAAGDTLSGVIGAGGLGAPSGMNNGSAGGNSTLSKNGTLLFTAAGGGGGVATPASAGGGGGICAVNQPTAAWILLTGSDGTDASSPGGGNSPGNGAPGWLGMGSGRGGAGGPGGGVAATAPCAGGGGAYLSLGPGGPGFAGFALIEWLR